MLNTEAPDRKRYFGTASARSWRAGLQVVVGFAVACLMLACASPGIPPVTEPDVARAGAEGEQRTVALLGGSGMVGGYLLQEALARGYAVRALARSPAKLEPFAGRITIVPGDARDPAAVASLVHGSDLVISALGPVKGDGDAARTINTTATNTVLQAMQDAGISRYIVVSGAAVVMPGDKRDLLGWWIRTLAQVGLSDALRDKQAEYASLAASNVDWMLVRCPLIDPESFLQPPMVSTQTPPAFRVRAGEVAWFIFEQVDSRQFVREGPFLGSR
ncbi:MAG: NAD(P)H-binding protein [Halioglobus sp.]|nr:NAD(P)H-binding protein [Halioglobus sp.]